MYVMRQTSVHSLLNQSDVSSLTNENVLQMTCPLKRLVLSGNDITCKGATALANALAKGAVDPKHRKEKARENAATLVKGNPGKPSTAARVQTLVELVLDRNAIKDEGAKATAQLLQVCAFRDAHFNSVRRAESVLPYSDT